MGVEAGVGSGIALGTGVDAGAGSDVGVADGEQADTANTTISVVTDTDATSRRDRRA